MTACVGDCAISSVQGLVSILDHMHHRLDPRGEEQRPKRVPEGWEEFPEVGYVVHMDMLTHQKAANRT